MYNTVWNSPEVFIHHTKINKNYKPDETANYNIYLLIKLSSGTMVAVISSRYGCIEERLLQECLQ